MTVVSPTRARADEGAAAVCGLNLDGDVTLEEVGLGAARDKLAVRLVLVALLARCARHGHQRQREVHKAVLLRCSIPDRGQKPRILVGRPISGKFFEVIKTHTVGSLTIPRACIKNGV